MRGIQVCQCSVHPNPRRFHSFIQPTDFIDKTRFWAFSSECAALVGFAHKPMPSFVATALLLPLLALVVKGGSAWHRRTLWLAALLAVLAAAIQLE